MSSFELNKVVGAVLIAVLAMVIIGKIGDNLVSTGGGHGGGHGGEHGADAPVTAKAPAPKAAAVKAVKHAAAPPAPMMNVAEMVAKADAARGKRVFNKCKACHSITKGGKNGIGPNLWNIVNRVPASVNGFKYSTAIRELKDKPWNYANLNAFLTKPKAYAKGTKMTFVGLKKDSDRANVIAYLRGLSDSPAALK